MQFGLHEACCFRPRPTAAQGVTVSRLPLPQLQHCRKASAYSHQRRPSLWSGYLLSSRELVAGSTGGVVGETSGTDDDGHRRNDDHVSANEPVSSAPSPPPPAATAAWGRRGAADGADPPSAAPPSAAEPPPLTLGSAVLERMAKLRALDQYRTLIREVTARAAAAEAAVAAAAAERKRQGSGRRRAAAAAATATDGCDDSSLLLRGALLIARHRYPSLDEGKVYGMLDEMARRVAALLPVEPGERYPLRVVAAINRVMYTDFGFRGNEEDYYSADNSCINRVLERRVGIPITLSLVYSEVARRVGLRIRGLNLPGHFMLQPLRPIKKQQQQQQQQQDGKLQPPASPPPPPSSSLQPRDDEAGSGGDVAGSSSNTSGSSSSSSSGNSSGNSSGTSGREEEQQQQQQLGREWLVGGGSEPNTTRASGGGGGGVDEGGGGDSSSSSGSATGRGAAFSAGGGGGAVEEEEEEEGAPLEVLIDAFRSGEVCYAAEAEERLTAVLGSPVRIDPRVLRESQPLPPRLFLLRMLGNLRSIYLSTQQVDPLLDVLKLMRATLCREGQEEEGAEGEGQGESSSGGGGGGAGSWRPSSSRSPSSSSPSSSSPSSSPSPLSSPFDIDPASAASASSALARDEGLCYFALRRYPECLEALREYVATAERSTGAPLPAEEAKTVSAVMEEARRRMTQQQQQQ